ncbi:MAG: response regulator [Elusimicrobia bacterium]|nr:response regulator [Elusimicrobiota bacterium]
MAIIGLVGSNEEDRRALSLAAGEAGHIVHSAAQLGEAVELLRSARPRLMVVVDSKEQDGALLLREILRASPLMPVVVALKKRDAARAVSLMRIGASEVVAPPWTRESLRSCLSKSLRFEGTSIGLAPPASRRGASFYFFAVLAFLACGLAVATLQRRIRLQEQSERAARRWDLPYQHPSTLAFDGASFWVVDWFTQSIYEHSAQDWSVKRLIHFPSETPVAVAFGADSAWTASASGAISRHMRDDKLTRVQSYREPGATLGLAFDGLYLWTCDGRSGRIHKRLNDGQLSVVASFPYPGLKAAALAFDGKTLWSLDAGNRELVRHNLERPDEASGRVALAEYRDGRYKPVGIAWDGQAFWTVGESASGGPARVFRHALRF